MQNQRDDKRKEILQSELASEKSALEQAKKAYAEGESNPEVYRTAEGKTFRNVPKFEEKMKTLQADVDNHQKNIQLLQKELDALK
jgi:cytochrome c556